MLVKLFYFLLGYVDFSFSGGFADDFVNKCYLNKVNIRNLCINGGVLYGRASIKAYKTLHRLALHCGGRVKIIKKHGMPFILYPLKNRWGLAAGVLSFVMLISFLSGFIWNITVVGNDRVTASSIVDYLAVNGFEVGSRWSSVDKERLEMQIMSDFDEVAWISINKFACLARIEISESKRMPDIIDNNIITNVKAEKDGVIVRVSALAGEPAVEAGSAVTAGDLLISGVFESEVDKQNYFVHAHGSVIARTQEKIELNISREQQKNEKISQIQYKTVYFFGIEIPLYFKKQGGLCESVVEKKYLNINSFRLPIGIYTETAEYYKTASVTLNDEELKLLAQSELEREKAKRFPKAEVLEENFSFDMSDGSCCAVAEYTFLEDIGAEEQILITETDE